MDPVHPDLLPLAPPSEPPDNVLEFRRREPGDDATLDALTRAPQAARPCPHMRQRLVDDKQRTVTCGDCGAALDPIWCLLTLVDYRDHLRRERIWIEAEKTRLLARREAAIKRRERTTQKAALVRARTNCRACDGTGWVSHSPGAGVVPCGCRTQGAKLL